MHRAWRYLGLSLAAFISFLLILPLILFLLSLAFNQMDQNRFRSSIEQQVSELTGRQLKIDGDLHLELSLQPSLSIEKVTFANATWSDRPQMLTLDKLYLKADLLPLFQDRLVVEQLVLQGAEISIENNPDAQLNWQLQTITADSPDRQADTADKPPLQLPYLPVLKQLQFDTIHIYYSDAVSAIRTDTSIDKLTLMNPDNAKATAIEATGSINQHPFSITGQSRFLADVTPENFTEQSLELTLAVDALYLDLNVSGEIANPAAGNGIDAVLSLHADDLEQTFIAATGQSIYRYIKKSDQPLVLDLSAKLSDIASDHSPDGQKFSGNEHNNHEFNSYELNDIRLKLGDNDLGGKLSYREGRERPMVKAELASRNLDINALLADDVNHDARKQQQSASTKGRPRQTGITLPDTPLPFAMLSSLDADIKLNIDVLRIDVFTPEAIKLDATLRSGLLTVKQLDLKLNKSAIRSSIIIDSRNDRTRIKSTLITDRLPLRPIMNRLQIDQLKSGTLHTRLNLHTRGNTIKSLVFNLKGNSDVRLDHAVLQTTARKSDHTARIKQLNMHFKDMREPLAFDLDATVDDEALSLSGKLNSITSLLHNRPTDITLDLAALKSMLTAQGRIDRPIDADSADIEISLHIPDPKTTVLKLSHFIPEIKQNEKLAGVPIEVHSKLTASTHRYHFDNLSLKAGNSDLSGSILADLSSTKPFIDASLESRLIDLNALVPATRLENDNTGKNARSRPDEDQSDKSSDVKLFSDKPLPAFGILDEFDINLAYTLQKLTSNDQVIDNITLKLTLKDSLLTLDPLQIDFSGGTIYSKLSLSAIGKPRIRLDTRISKLDYDRLMTILGTREYARGKMDAEIVLDGEGRSVSELMASLNGMVRATTVDGILDSDSLKLLSQDIVSIIPFTDSSNRQKIYCGVIQFDIKNGIATSHAMVINTGAISALGTGDIDLKDETIDMYVAPRSKRTSVIKIALVPVNITGPLSDPSVTPDLAGSTISTTKTAANIGLTIATSGIWLLAEGFTNDLWDKFIDDTDYCARALAGDRIAPQRIRLQEESTSEDNDDTDLFDDDDGGW